VPSSYIDQALMYTAKQSTAVTAVFGQRIFHIRAPQRTEKPYAVLRIVAPSNEIETFDDDAYGQPLFQWTCVSDDRKTPCDAFVGAHALLDLFRNYSGSMDGVTVDYLEIRGPTEIELPQTQDIACIVELVPHYVEP
jgi:hypothetical protein